MDTNVQVSNSAQIAQNRLLADVMDLLNRVDEYMGDRADVEDGDYGVPLPNVEMSFSAEIQSIMEKLERLKIVSTFPGSEPRKVLVKNIQDLELILKNSIH